MKQVAHAQNRRNMRRNGATHDAENQRQILQPLLTPAETAQILGLAEQTLANWRATGASTLKWIKLGGGRVRYRSSDVEEFLAQCVRNA